MKSLILAALFTIASVSVSTAFAYDDGTDADVPALAKLAKTHLHEERELENGVCYVSWHSAECVWDIQDSGRTPDTLHATYTSTDGENFVIESAYEEHGC
jgi:hypothetical protein